MMYQYCWLIPGRCNILERSGNKPKPCMMKTKLIPFRTYHFSVPAHLVAEVLHIVLGQDISYSIDAANVICQSLDISCSINLQNTDQREAIDMIGSLLSLPAA